MGDRVALLPVRPEKSTFDGSGRMRDDTKHTSPYPGSRDTCRHPWKRAVVASVAKSRNLVGNVTVYV